MSIELLIVLINLGWVLAASLVNKWVKDPKWIYRISLPGCIFLGLSSFFLAWWADLLFNRFIHIGIGLLGFNMAWGWVKHKRELDRFERELEVLKKTLEGFRDIEEARVKEALWKVRN